MKKLWIVFSLLFLAGCQTIKPSAPTGSTQMLSAHATSTNSPTEAILQLDTGGHTARIWDVIVTRSGHIISASDDKTIRVWDSQTGLEKRKILGQIGAGEEGKIYAIALSPNEEFLAVGGYLAGTRESGEIYAIRIYHYPSGRLLKVLKSHKNVVFDLAFDSKGEILISGSSDKTAKLWQVENGQLLETIKTHNKEVYAVKLLRQGGELLAISAGYDQQISRYSLRQKKTLNTVSLPYKLDSLATSAEHIAVSGKGKEIRIFDIALNPIKTIRSETEPAGLAYSQEGEYLIAGRNSTPNNVNIYRSSAHYQKISSFKQHKNLVRAVAFLDAKTAVSAGGNNFEIYLWDVTTAQIKQRIQGLGKPVWSVGIAGDRLAWGNKSNYKNHLDRGELQKSITLKNFSIQDSPSDLQAFKRIASTHGAYRLSHKAGGNYGKSDAVLELKQGNKTLASITRDATNGYQHRSYGFYQRWIVSGGSNGHLKVYDFSGKEVANLVGHTGEVWSLALDGDRLVSGGSDQTIRVWDLSQLKPTMYPQLTLFITKDNEWIAWTNEGFYNASKGGEKYIGYHINQGADKEAQFLDISRFKKQFYRPDLIAKAVNGEDLSQYAKSIDINALLTAGLPPRVEILTSPQSIHSETLEIGVKLCEQDGGFENLNFYVDNKPIRYLSRSKAFRQRTESADRCSVIEQRIAIPSGQHQVSFNATNKRGNIISNTPSITVTNNTVLKKKPNLHLLTLSIKDYKDDALDLEYPNRDADKLSETLKTIGQPIFENVYTHALKDSQVTQQQIEAKVAEIAPKVDVNDVFVLFLSGHGVTNKTDGDYYFIPYNAPKGSDETQTAINQQRFKAIMSQIPAVKSVVLLDTCESGSAASQDLLNTSINRFGGNVGSAIIAGATRTQNAIDGYKQHGIFTYTLLDAMRNEKVYSFDDKLSINEIAEYTKYLLPKLAKEAFEHEQQPTIYLNGDTTFALGGLK